MMALRILRVIREKITGLDGDRDCFVSDLIRLPLSFSWRGRLETVPYVFCQIDIQPLVNTTHSGRTSSTGLLTLYMLEWG